MSTDPNINEKGGFLMNTIDRMHDLDAVRAFALLLGVVFHACLSFVPIPIGWAVMDVSTSPAILGFLHVSHSFRMPLFFLIAGFFGRMTLQRKGTGTFLKSRAVRLGVPFVVGWWILWPLIISGWIMGSARMRGEVEVGSALVAAFASLGQLPKGLFVQTHLWFLYYLVLITLITVCLRGLIGLYAPVNSTFEQLGDKLSGCLSKPWGVLMVALPTALVLLFMRVWGMDTPDKSLVPHIPVLLVYGGAFQIGWVLNRTPDVLNQWIRPGWIRWSLLSLGLGCSLWLSQYQADPSHPHLQLFRLGFVASYALMMWTLVFLTIGLFKRWMSRSRTCVRYIADASYWIYLLHLPIVVWLQVAVADLSMHWSIKWGIVSFVTIGICLLSYDLFVRSTLVGKVLTGRRRERVLRIPALAASSARSTEECVHT
jgi:peptidoglycan/LPS O-acetylase OafA/YrhL